MKVIEKKKIVSYFSLTYSEMEYFTDEVYSFDHAKSIRFDDSVIGVDWTLNGLNWTGIGRRIK